MKNGEKFIKIIIKPWRNILQAKNVEISAWCTMGHTHQSGAKEEGKKTLTYIKNVNTYITYT